jgi:hypothetical protein
MQNWSWKIMICITDSGTGRATIMGTRRASGSDFLVPALRGLKVPLAMLISLRIFLSSYTELCDALLRATVRHMSYMSDRANMVLVNAVEEKVIRLFSRADGHLYLSMYMHFISMVFYLP